MDPNQDPEAQNVQGLRLSQAQGLPLAGSLPLSGGLPLGAVPRLPLAPVQVQGQPTGTPERIGNVLQSIAAGMQGQVAPWEQIQQAQQDRALRQQQLAQQQQMQEATLPHLAAQTQLLQGQVAELGWKTIQHATMALPFVPEDKQQAFLDSIRPVIQQQFKMAAPHDPAGVAIASDDKFIDAMVRSGQEKAKAFLQGWTFLPEVGKMSVAQLAMSDPQKAAELAKTLSEQNVETIVSGLGTRIRATGIEGATPRSYDQAMAMAKATPQERAAAQQWLGTAKPDAVDRVFQALNIIPPSIGLKAGEAGAVELAKEGTPGGQAGIAEKRASTVLKGQEAVGAGVKTVPGQGGALITLPGTIASGATGGGNAATLADAGRGLREKAAATSDPVLKASLLKAADAADAARAPMAGLQVPPGVGVLAQTPGAPMAPEAAKQISITEEIVRTLKRIGGYANDKSLNAYIGPPSTRPMGAMTEAVQTKTPFGGSLPPRAVDLQQGMGQLANFTILNITGAAVRETEEPRILKEVPDLKRDKPEVFWQKYHQTLQTNEVLLERKKAMYGPDGRMKAGLDPEEIAKKYPLPAPLAESVTGPQGTVRVKPGTSNATGR